MNKYMYFFQKATYFQQLWFTTRCNFIILMLEALLSLLKKQRSLARTWAKYVHVREGERADQGEVTVDTGGGRHRCFAADQRADHRGEAFVDTKGSRGGRINRKGRLSSKG